MSVIKGPAVYTSEASNLSKTSVYLGVSTIFIIIILQWDKVAIWESILGQNCIFLILISFHSLAVEQHSGGTVWVYNFSYS